MKKSILLSLIILISVSSCTYYKINNRTKPTVDLNKYDKIYVGWLDLGEEKWGIYPNINEKDWIDIINRVNRSALQSLFKEVFTDKTIISSKMKNDAPPKNCLYIQFQNANYIYSDDKLSITIIFIDSATSQILSKVSVTVKAWRGGGWRFWSFEEKVINCVRNLAYFIREKMF